MLKIAVTETPDGPARFALEGRLVGPWVEELRRLSHPILAAGRGLILDLAGVAFVDREGVALLRCLAEGGAALVAPTPFVAEQCRAGEAGAGAAADLALVARLRAGDPTALEILMERYAGRVWRVAHGITRSAQDAEEVVQDVFLGLTRAVAGFEGRAQLGTWVYRIATNAALNKRRGRRFDLETSLDAGLPRFKADGHREGERAWVVADWSATPEQELLSRERRAVLARAIEALPARYRAVLVLRDVEELESAEVAEILGESVASVKSRLHRARMALREGLTRVVTGDAPAESAAPARVSQGCRKTDDGE